MMYLHDEDLRFSIIDSYEVGYNLNSTSAMDAMQAAADRCKVLNTALHHVNESPYEFGLALLDSSPVMVPAYLGMMFKSPDATDPTVVINLDRFITNEGLITPKSAILLAATLVHEHRHVQQVLEGRLNTDDPSNIIWDGMSYGGIAAPGKDYIAQPWERDAYEAQCEFLSALGQGSFASLMREVHRNLGN